MLSSLLADFSGDELDDAEVSNATALLSPGSASAARAGSAEDTGSGSGSGEIGGAEAEAAKAGVHSSQRGLNRHALWHVGVWGLS